MTHSRRHFLGLTAFLVAAWGARALRAQGNSPLPPIDHFPDGPFGNSPLPEHRLSAEERMKMNQAQIKKDMTRLKEAVNELQKEFDANNAAAVLSMGAIRKTEEIERLAREIRGLIRG